MYKIFKRLLTVTSVISGALLISCFAYCGISSAAKKVKVISVSVSDSNKVSSKLVYVSEGKTVKLKVKVKAVPNKACNRKVFYRSANKKVARVNDKGIVKGIKAGTTKVTVISTKDKKKKLSIKIVVKKVKKTPVSTPLIPPTNTPAPANQMPVLSDAIMRRLNTTSSPKAKKELALPTPSPIRFDEPAKNFGAAPIYDVPDGVHMFMARILGAGTKVEFRNAGYNYNRDDMVVPRENISIWTRSNPNGEFDKKLTFNDMTSYPGGFDYFTILTLDDNCKLIDNQDILLEITLSDGKKIQSVIKYVEYYRSRTYEMKYTAAVNNKFKARFEYSYEYDKCTISELPEGLTAVYSDGILYIDGTPVRTGITNVVITVTNPEGEVFTENAVIEIVN